MTYEQFQEAVKLNERISFIERWIEQNIAIIPEELRECCKKETEEMKLRLKEMIKDDGESVGNTRLTTSDVTNALSNSLSNREAARRLGISERTLYRYLDQHPEIKDPFKRAGRPPRAFKRLNEK